MSYFIVFILLIAVFVSFAFVKHVGQPCRFEMCCRNKIDIIAHLIKHKVK